MTKPISAELAEQILDQLGLTLSVDLLQGVPAYTNSLAQAGITDLLTQAIAKAIEPYQQKVEGLERELVHYKELHTNATKRDARIKREMQTRIQELEAHNALLREALELVNLGFIRPEKYYPAKCENENCGYLASSELFNTDGSEDSGIFCPKCNADADEYHADQIIKEALSSTPTQSLDSIRAKVVDECVEAVKLVKARNVVDWNGAKDRVISVDTAIKAIQSIKKEGQ